MTYYFCLHSTGGIPISKYKAVFWCHRAIKLQHDTGEKIALSNVVMTLQFPTVVQCHNWFWGSTCLDLRGYLAILLVNWRHLFVNKNRFFVDDFLRPIQLQNMWPISNDWVGLWGGIFYCSVYIFEEFLFCSGMHIFEQTRCNGEYRKLTTFLPDVVKRIPENPQCYIMINLRHLKKYFFQHFIQNR